MGSLGAGEGRPLLLIHGGRDPSLRAPAVLDALPSLVAAGRMEAEEASGLADAYRRLEAERGRVQSTTSQINAAAVALEQAPAAVEALEKAGAAVGLGDVFVQLECRHQEHFRLVVTLLERRQRSEREQHGRLAAPPRLDQLVLERQ